MLSSLTNSPQFAPQVDLNSFFSYDQQPEEDYLSVINTAPPLELTKKFSNESSTSASKGLNTPSSQQKVIEKITPNSTTISTSINSTSQPDSSQVINTKRNDSFLNKSQENELNVPTKKLKTEKPSKQTVYDSIMEGFQVLESYESPDVFEEDKDITKTDRQVKELEKLLQVGGNLPWYALKSSRKEIEKESELSKALEILKDFKLPKYDLPRDSSYECNLIFEIPPSLMKPEPQIEVQEAEQIIQEEDSGSLKEISDSGIKSPDLTKNLSVQSDVGPTSESSNKALQSIKASLDAIHEADFDRLQPEVYLNDNLINFYLK